MSEAFASITLGLIKVVMGLYGLSTLPLYFVIQQPWKYWRKRKAVWAHPMVQGDSSSPYVRSRTLKKKLLADDATVDQLFRTSAVQFKDRPCFGTREVFGEEEHVQQDGTILKKLILGDYKWMTFREAEEEVERVARSLLSIGVKPKQPVLILAETRVEWMIIAQAIFRIGSQVATLYATLGENGIIHGINETEVSVVVTSHSLLPKLQKIMPQIPGVNFIIYMEGMKPPSCLNEFPKGVKLVSYSHFKSLSESSFASEEVVAYESPLADDVALIMYTSGSTGVPKGVLITHRNLLVIVRSFQMITETMRQSGRHDLSDVHFIGYLPLAHLFELTAEMAAISVGVKTGYSSPQTLIDKSSAIKEGQQGDAALIRPDLMIAVPLLLDRILKSVKEATASRGLFSKWFFNYAVSYKIFWTSYGFQTPILDRLLFGKIRRMMGGKLRYMATGGAALSPDTHRFTEACLGVKVFSGYGMTETGGAGTIMDLDDLNYGTVGAPSLMTQIRLIDWEEGNYYVTDKPNPRGEILIGGPNVSPGYYKNNVLTKETFFTENGVRWCRTGDVGEMLPDGTLKIIDRKKDLVKLQHGEYVSLSKVEALLKTHLLVDNMCVFGCSFSSYLVALVVPNERQLKAFADEQLGRRNYTLAELCDDREVADAVANTLRKHAIKCHMHRTEIPKKVKLCKEEWIPETGLVTATFKIKRAALYKFYHQEIQNMYNENFDHINLMNGSPKQLIS